MSKIILIIFLFGLCCVVGCEEEEEQKFNVGDKVYIVRDNVIGTVHQISPMRSDGCKKYIYQIIVHKEDLKGSVIYSKNSNEINQFIDDPR